MERLDRVLHNLEGVRVKFHAPLLHDLEELVDLRAIAGFLPPPAQDVEHAV